MEDKRARLLVVEDEEQVLEVLVEELEDLELPNGFEILTAKNGSDAFNLIRFQPFDAVLSDIMMPVMSGLEFLHKIRASGFEVPVIFLTGASDKEKAVEALRLGAFDFLEKPWNHEQLARSVAQALNLGTQMRFWDQEIEANLAKFKGADPATLKQLKQSYLAMKLLKYVSPPKKKAA